MSCITALTPKDNFKLEVTLDIGSGIILNFERRLHTIRFGMLADKEFFESATTDGLFIFWKGKVEISLSEAFQLVQKP